MTDTVAGSGSSTAGPATPLTAAAGTASVTGSGAPVTGAMTSLTGAIAPTGGPSAKMRPPWPRGSARGDSTGWRRRAGGAA